MMASLVLKKSVIVPLRRLLYQSRDYGRRSSRNISITEYDVRAVFEEWSIDYGRVYKSVEEKERRFLVFKESFWWVKKFNIANASTGRVGLNQFADWTPAELRMLGGCIELTKEEKINQLKELVKHTKD